MMIGGEDAVIEHLDPIFASLSPGIGKDIPRTPGRSVIASWLLDLTASALVEDPALAKFAGRVSGSGEGR
jgi:6-phosphogluconate dehydrogenase (decarboxylating)